MQKAHGGDPAGRRSAALILVTGVSASGKTTVGKAAAARLGWRFVDADDYHTAQARERMSRGQALDDDDRRPWLDRLDAVIGGAAAAGEPLVMACSALKHAYRERLLAAAAGSPALLVFLQVDPATAHARLERRPGHFAGPSLASSQFATLEPPDGALVLDASLPVDDLVSCITATVDEVTR